MIVFYVGLRSSVPGRNGKVTHLISQLGLPQRLRDVGVKEAELPDLAQAVLKSQAVQNNPKPLTDATQAEALLRAAW